MKETIKFSNDPLIYTVMAQNERYKVCTRKLNKRVDAKLLWNCVENQAFMSFTQAYIHLKDEPIYTIIDLVEKIRGTENLVFGMGFDTKELCEEALQRITDGESEISHRNRVGLDIKQ